MATPLVGQQLPHLCPGCATGSAQACTSAQPVQHACHADATGARKAPRIGRSAAWWGATPRSVLVARSVRDWVSA